MLDVPIAEGNSDSQDLNRTIETLVRRHGLSLAEAMEMVVPPIVDEIAGLPAELHSFYMYLRQTMGPFAQGPVALIARHLDECVFSADAMGLRPLWQVETPHDFIFSSEPGVVPVQEMISEPQPMAPGQKFLVLIDRERKRSTLHPHAEMLRKVRERWMKTGRGGAGRAVRPRARDRRPARGARDPRLHGRRSGGSRPGGGPRPRRLRLAARRRQARPADGRQRRRADRLARLRRAAGGALTGAAEPRRLLQGDGRGRHQPGDRPRARDRALLDPRRLRAPAGARRSRRRTAGRSRPTSR